MNVKQQVESRFSPIEDSVRWDAIYDHATESVIDEFFRLRRDFTIDYIVRNFRAGAQICDLGCGAGPVIATLLNLGFDAVGFDYSPDMLANAARRIMRSGSDGRPLVRTDVQKLPLRNESFDCAVCLGVISYVEDYAAVLAEIRRILKPGGTAIVTYRNEKNLMVSDPLGPARYAAKKIAYVAGLRRKQFRIGDHMSHSEVTRTVQDCGLVIEQFKGIGFGPLRLNHKPVLSDRTSLRVHRRLTRWFERLGMELPFRVGTDVHILVVRRPFEDTSLATTQ